MVEVFVVTLNARTNDVEFLLYHLKPPRNTTMQGHLRIFLLTQISLHKNNKSLVSQAFSNWFM